MSDLKSKVRALRSQQFDEADLKRILKEIQKLPDDEAIKAYLNKESEKIIGSGYHPRTKAYLTDRLLQQVIGTAALEELPGLAESGLSPSSIEKVQKQAYGPISDLEKALSLNPEISIKELPSAGMYVPSKGIILNEAYLDPELLSQALGTSLHEASHKADMVGTAVQAQRQKLGIEDIRKLKSKYNQENFNEILKKVESGIYDPEVKQFFKDANIITLSPKQIAVDPGAREDSVKKIEELVRKYKKEYPEKISDTEDILSWRSKPHAEENKFIERLIKSNIDISSASPLQLQEAFSGAQGDHWYKKNFPLDSVLGVAKKGLKGVKSIAPIAAKIGVPMAGLYSGYSEASEEGMPVPLAAAYALAEEANPLPISGIDYYKGMEKAAKGRASNIEANYMPEELRVEKKALEQYRKSPAAQSKAFSDLRKFLETEENKDLLKELLKTK